MNEKCFFLAETTVGSFTFWMRMKNCTFDGRVSVVKVRIRALERMREKMINGELPNVRLLKVKLIKKVESKPTRQPLSPEERFQKQIQKYGDTPPYWR